MKVTRTSMLSGKIRTFDLEVTQEQLDAYAEGTICIQDAFPHLGADEREFLKTGIVSEEWEAAFGEEE